MDKQLTVSSLVDPIINQKVIPFREKFFPKFSEWLKCLTVENCTFLIQDFEGEIIRGQFVDPSYD